MVQLSFANCCGCKMTITPAGIEGRVVVDNNVVAYVHAQWPDCVERARRKFAGCKIQGGQTTVRQWSPTGRSRDDTGKAWRQPFTPSSLTK